MSKKKKMQLEDAAEQQAIEVTEAEEAPSAITEELKVDFDTWYVLREPQIPAHHRKEIIKADFKGRGISVIATMAEFDEALRKYGIKLV